jgi:hypothetical protein
LFEERVKAHPVWLWAKLETWTGTKKNKPIYDIEELKFEHQRGHVRLLCKKNWARGWISVAKGMAIFTVKGLIQWKPN